MEFRELNRDGITRNSAEFSGIHTDSGIAGIDSVSGIRRNWTELRGIPTDSGIAGITSDSGILPRNRFQTSPSHLTFWLEINHWNKLAIPERNPVN